MEIRNLDILLATIGTDGCAPGVDNAVTHLADGAIRLKQGEYLWPLAMQGRPVPEGQMPLPPAFTSAHITDPGYAAMRSDWSAQAHYMLIDGDGNFTAHAYGRKVASGSGLAPAGPHSLWTTGLFLDALSAGESRTVLFVKPVGDLPGYWLAAGVAEDASPDGPWMAIEGERSFLLAPYDRFPSQLGTVRCLAWASGGARCYRVIHALGYDILFIGDGEQHTFPDVELTTDARFALFRVRGHQAVARQASRCSSLIFREEALA